jgi:hypothetical protein
MSQIPQFQVSFLRLASLHTMQNEAQYSPPSNNHEIFRPLSRCVRRVSHKWKCGWHCVTFQVSEYLQPHKKRVLCISTS